MEQVTKEIVKERMDECDKMTEAEHKRLNYKKRLHAYKAGHIEFHKNLIRFYHFRLIGPKLEIMPYGGVTLAVLSHKCGFVVVPTRCSLQEMFCKFSAREQTAIRYDNFREQGAPKLFPVFVVSKRPTYEQLKDFAWSILYDYVTSDQEYLNGLNPALYTVSTWRKEIEEE